VDPNITFINNPIWTNFRAPLVHFGYYQRETSSFVFLTFIILLFLFHLYFIKNAKKISLPKLVIPLAILGVFSYPFLSHDLFNYMFDAKILTFYHLNPYLHKALDFPHDPWLRFLQWTHRPYPYGPVFLLISAVPSMLSFGKFVLSFLLFKSTSVFFYLLGIYLLQKLNKKWAVFFATNPLIITEGLVNAHNDLVGLTLAIVGIYYLLKKNDIKGKTFLLVSTGIKYITFPLVLLSRNNGIWNKLTVVLLTAVLAYLSFFAEIQPWYFLVVFALLPFYQEIIKRLNIFFAGLVLSYYPYIRYGDWGMKGNVQMKHEIILFFFILNLVYITYSYFKKLKA